MLYEVITIQPFAGRKFLRTEHAREDYRVGARERFGELLLEDLSSARVGPGFDHRGRGTARMPRPDCPDRLPVSYNFV